VLEPQSTLLFVLLIAIFGGLTWWLLRARLAALRVLAAVVSFTVAMMFGVLVVNKYYGYYQTWGAAVADLTTQGVTVPQVSASSLASGTLYNSLVRSANLRLAQRQGYTVRMNIAGQLSHITRVVYVYLPPQYFQPAYKDYRFPVIELIHGQPGVPQDWINVVGVTLTLDQLVAARLARPVVLIMPDANGGVRVSLQCLNQVHGPQDLTYLAQDLPDKVAHILRVQPPGPAWGVAGYSEGGFCAANMALRFRHRYGFAGVISGYFRPFDNQLPDPLRRVSAFGGNRALQLANTPLDEIEKLPAGAVLPKFWLGAGTDDKLDVDNAKLFWQELQLHQADVPLTLTPGGGHNMATWRPEVALVLRWMSEGLARVARQNEVVGPAVAASLEPGHAAWRGPGWRAAGQGSWK
jgi:enterochelin esterase-like enzyme